MSELTPARRRELKAQAHHLNPVASVASNGLTDAVLAEIDRGLKAHELIKVRVYGEDRAQRQAWMQEICERLQASAVQHIGNILILWREAREEDRVSAAPRENKPQGTATLKSAKAFAAAARRRLLAEAARQRSAPGRGGKRPISRGR